MNSPAHRTEPVRTRSLSVGDLVDEVTENLRVDGARAERCLASDIVAALLEVPRSWPALNRTARVDEDTAARARAAVLKLGRGAPFAYAVGSAPFRHLSLSVDERVLIPRPETELLVGEILERMTAAHGDASSWGTAVDIGTGSGAIALSLASEGRFERVIATDASLDALALARANAAHCGRALRTEVEFRHGSLTAPLTGVRATVMVSNPPYIAYSEAETLPASVRDWEPPIALYSGRDGMSATAEIVRNGGRYLTRGGLLALEVDERRASLVAELVLHHGGYRDVGVRLDLTGRERFVFASRN